MTLNSYKYQPHWPPPPAACPLEEKPAQTRGLRSAAARVCAERLRVSVSVSVSVCVLEAVETWGEKTAVSQTPFGEPAKLGAKVRRVCETCPGG